MNSKPQLTFKKPLSKVNFLTPFKERKKEPRAPQDKMLSILNYRSDADQKDKKWNPARMAILTVCKQYMEESPGRWWNPSPSRPPSCFLGTDIGNNSLKGQPAQARTKKVKRAKPRILIPTPKPTLQKNIIQNYIWTPTFTAVVPPTAKTQT